MLKNILGFLVFWELVQLPGVAIWFSESIPPKTRVLLVTAIVSLLFFAVIANFLKKLGMEYAEIGVKLPQKSELTKYFFLLFSGTVACLLWAWGYLGVFKILLPAEYARLAVLKSTGYLQFLSDWGKAGGFYGTAALWCGMLLLVAAEELAFRGLIFNYIQRESSFNKALLWSSALFAVVHLNVYNFPVSFVLGLILTLLYVRSGGLAVPISVHLAYNLSLVYFGKYLH